MGSGFAGGFAGSATTQAITTGSIDWKSAAGWGLVGAGSAGVLRLGAAALTRALATSAAEGAESGAGRSLLQDLATNCNSFAAGTLVVLADGSTKAIDKVAVGDRVRTTDPATGEEVVRTVTQLHLDHDTDMADVVVRDGAGREATVHTTQHHRFWDDTKGGWIDAGALLAGDRLHSDDGSTTTVVAVRSWDAAQWMYDLTVDGVHTFYVRAGTNPVLVHNCALSRLPFPDDVVPEGMTRNAWGNKVWGQGPDAARALIGARSAQEWQDLGLTAENAARLRDFYQSAQTFGRGATTSSARADLMQHIYDLLSGGGGG